MAKRLTAGLLVAFLLGVAAYSIYVAIAATSARGGKQYDPPLFWTAIGLFWVIATASVWGAHRIYRRRFLKVSR
jgi:membrane protein implicated in regulation of membrane protease activity